MKIWIYPAPPEWEVPKNRRLIVPLQAAAISVAEVSYPVLAGELRKAIRVVGGRLTDDDLRNRAWTEIFELPRSMCILIPD